MHLRMYAEGTALDLARSLQHAPLPVQQQQVARLDPGPMNAPGVEKETVPRLVQRVAEMVADPLVQPEARRQTQCGGEIDAGVPLVLLHSLTPVIALTFNLYIRCR